MLSTDLKERTKKFSLRIVGLCKTLKQDWMSVTIGKQVLRCGTSVGANYRATVLAKSKKDFINKLKIVEEELDETLFWIELLIEAEVVPQSKLQPLIKEGTELLKITTASILTAKANQKKEKTKPPTK
jgi:four helix bundle protein